MAKKQRVITETRNYLYKHILNIFVNNRYKPNEDGDLSVVTILNGGGSRAGKTYVIANIIWKFMVNYANPNAANRKKLHIIIYRDTLVSARATFIDIIDAFNSMGLREGSTQEIKLGIADYESIKSAEVQIKMYGHLIEFKGYPEEGKEPSGCDISFINELVECKNEKVFFGIKRRTTMLFMADWNPKDSVHWAYEVKGHNVFYTKTTYLDNKHLPEGLKAGLERQCPWEFEDSQLYIETHKANGEAIFFDVPEGFEMKKWKAGEYEFDGYLRRRWLKDERPENCEEKDYHLYRRPNLKNLETKSIDRTDWLTYGQGEASAQEGAIFKDVVYLSEFPDNEVDRVLWGLDFGWTCFAGETKIQTISGEKQIKDIKIGDYVLTPNGHKKVLNVFDNGIKEVVDINIGIDFGYRNFICTFDHKFKTDKGWKQLKDLQKGEKLCLTASSMVKNIQDTQMENTRTISTHQQTRVNENFIERFGNLIMGKYQMVNTYTILTGIRLITLLKTSLLLLALNMRKYMTILNTLSQRKLIQKRIGTKEEKRLLRILNKSRKSVSNAESFLPQQIPTKGRVQDIVITNINILLLNLMKRISVKFVEVLSKGINILNKKLALINVRMSYQQITDLQIKRKYYENVYDIEVEGEHCYYANGVLVHNCDPSVLTKVGVKGKDKKQLFIEYKTYHPTRTVDILYDAIKPHLIEEENRLKSILGEKYESEQYIICDSKNDYKDEYMILGLNERANVDGFNWNFIPAQKPRVIIRLEMMKRYDLYVVQKGDQNHPSRKAETEFNNYVFRKLPNGITTNEPIDDFNHGMDSWGYTVLIFAYDD